MKKHKKNTDKDKEPQLIKQGNALNMVLEVLTGITAIVYPAINLIHNLLYQIECEKFYGIPGEYFSSRIDNKIIYLASITLIVLICVLPSFLRKYENDNESTNAKCDKKFVFLSILGGFILGLLNTINLIELLKYNKCKNLVINAMGNKLSIHPIITICIVILLGIVVVIGISFHDKIYKMKKKWMINILLSVFWIAAVINAMLISCDINTKLSISIEDETKYEFAYNENKYVVLSRYEDKVLAVPYDIDENGEYVFKTSEYILSDPCVLKYSYVDIKKPPHIQAEKRYFME